MGHHAGNEIARRFPGRQHRFSDCLGHLHFVAHMFLTLFTLAFAGIGRVGIMRILHPFRTQLLLGLGLRRRLSRQHLKLLIKHPRQQLRLLSRGPLRVRRLGQPTEHLLGGRTRFGHLARQRFERGAVIGLRLDVLFPRLRPPTGPLGGRQLFGQFLQGQTQRLAHAIQAAHPADPTEHLRRIQTLAASACHQARLDQCLQHGLESDGAQVMIQQAPTEVDQRRGMEHLVPDLPVQREVPAGMVADQFDGLTVRHRLQILQQAHAQQQDRFNRHTAIVGAVTVLQLGARLRQYGIDLLGKEPVTVGGGEELAGEPGGGKEFGLGGKNRQAHGTGP